VEKRFLASLTPSGVVKGKVGVGISGTNDEVWSKWKKKSLHGVC